MSTASTNEIPIGVSYGGGVNSLAMLVGMYERGIIPDVIEYADPGKWLDDPAEKPETYNHIDNHVQPWLKSIGFPAVTIVRHKADTLKESCLRNGTLPSKAYGFSGCSVKFKHQLMESYERELFGDGFTIIKAIGYHAGEEGRSDIAQKVMDHGGTYLYRYFLREWKWYQGDCIAAIERVGIPIPLKSACWFCPSSKKWEIIWLAENHPELFAQAVAMEHNARKYHAARGNITQGLGRTFSWEELVKNYYAVPPLFEAAIEPDPIPCMCYDGGDDDE